MSAIGVMLLVGLQETRQDPQIAGGTDGGYSTRADGPVRYRTWDDVAKAPLPRSGADPSTAFRAVPPAGVVGRKKDQGGPSRDGNAKPEHDEGVKLRQDTNSVVDL
jgi:hypothetical protein